MDGNDVVQPSAPHEPGDSIAVSFRIRLAPGRRVGSLDKKAMADDLITGGCYCRAIRYECRGPLLFRGLCFCRTCQMISGGAGNLFAAVDAPTFQFTSGSPRSFTNEEHAWRPIRHFCEICGVHLTSRSERAASAVLIKVGTLDDPSLFAGPQVVTWTSEMQKFHLLPPDVPAHPELPRAPTPKEKA